MRVLGVMKVIAVIAVDYAVLYETTGGSVASLAISGIVLYTFFGGYLALAKDGAVPMDKLPQLQRLKLEGASNQICSDVERGSGVKMHPLNLYLIPDDQTMNASAYGFNCVSVTAGTLQNADSVTLVGVLAHEVAHLRSSDPEFNRAVFASVTALLLSLSLVSIAVIAVIFVIFLVIGALNSFFGIMVFKGTVHLSNGLTKLFQNLLIAFYRTLISYFSRRAEFRCDLYACYLGYGIQLQHFLSIAAPDTPPESLRDVLYRSHPPTCERIARLEEHANQEISI